MGLKYKNDPTVRIGASNGLERGSDLGRVVPIVIHKLSLPPRKGQKATVL
jgi:hypothetical protein